MNIFTGHKKHRWKKVHDKPWLKTFGNVDVVECKDCHIFANVKK